MTTARPWVYQWQAQETGDKKPAGQNRGASQEGLQVCQSGLSSIQVHASIMRGKREHHTLTMTNYFYNIEILISCIILHP